MVGAREDRLEVVLLPGLGRAPLEEPERVLAEARLGDERRDRGGDQREHRERSERDQERAEAGERDQRLDRAHHVLDVRDRAVRRLAPGLSHAIVERGILEVRELERERLLEDHLVDPLGDQRPQQRSDDALHALDPVDREHQRQLDRDRDQDLAARRGLLDRAHDRVDDPAPGPGDRGRGDPAHQAEPHEREREPAMGAEHEPEGASRLLRALAEPRRIAPRRWLLVGLGHSVDERSGSMGVVAPPGWSGFGRIRDDEASVLRCGTMRLRCGARRRAPAPRVQRLPIARAGASGIGDLSVGSGPTESTHRR